MTPEQRIQFETQGYLHLPGALNPPLLARLSSAFDAASRKFESTPHDAQQLVSDIPNILDEDDVFADLLDAPGVFPVLLDIIGGDIQLLQTQARLFKPGKMITAPWHSDLALINGIEMAHSTNFMVKAHYYPEDLSADQGCLAFIPGSHRYPAGMPRPKVDHENPSSLVVKIVPKAGDVILFNVHLLHMALDNKSNRVRKSLIYAYSHFWVKNCPSAVPKDLQRLATTPRRRQLFGIPASQVEGSYFEQTLLPREPQGRIGEVLSAGRDFLSRTRNALT